MQNIIPPDEPQHNSSYMKRCTGQCGQEYPATSEYFCKNSQRKDKLNNECKTCKSKKMKAYRSRPDVKEHIKEQQKEYQKEYFKNYKRKSYKEQQKAYYKNNKERIKAYQRSYYEFHKEQQKSYHETYDKTYGKNLNFLQIEIRRNKQKEYYSRLGSKELNRIRTRNRRARKKAIQGTYTIEQIQDQLRRQKHKCYYCKSRFKKTKGRYIYHIEHTFPLSRVVGTNIPANSIDYIVLSCPDCNLSKGNKFPWEYPEGGRLL